MSDRHTRRDTAFDRTLAQGLGRQPAPSDRCPDPEIIAAFWDRSLPSAERRTCEDHVSRCGRCQAQLATLVRTSRLLEDDRSVIEPSALHWLVDWRWLAPLATAAAVLLAVWVVDPGSVTDQTAPAATDAQSERVSDSALPELPEAELAPSLRGRSDLQVATLENAQVEANALDAVDEVLPVDQVPPAATPATQPELRDAAPPTSSPEPAEELAERRLSVQSADTRSVASPLRTERFEDTVETVVISPDPATRWRLAANAVEHSGDGGVTWTLQLAGTGRMLTAGSAPSAAVCWIVGRAGTVFRTVDGGDTWEQVGAPTETDLVAVEALDGQSATVEGIDATSFRTQDGGQSWDQVE